MEKKKYSMKKITSHPDFQISLISILFGIIIAMGKTGSDDIRMFGWLEPGVKGVVKWVVDQYYTWSSRQLVDFVWAGVVKCGRIALVIYMAVCMFVMLKALKLLFGETNKRVELFAVAMMMLMPFDTLPTAGWIATTASYFGPQAFGVMALLPIKKVLDGEQIKPWQFILYCLCLLYGANAEQMCVVLLGCYVVASVYMIIKNKKYDWRIGILTGLTIASMIYIMTCPGNWTRDVEEVARWFPTYGMLDMVDKADIGITTTLKWMFASGKIFIIVICGMMTYFVWKKYKEPIYRFISLIPTAAVLLFGPFSGALKSVFPYLYFITEDMNYYGSFTADVAQLGKGMASFFILLGIVVCICVEIFLLNDDVQGMIVDFTLAILAVASRAMMGFSPTVYASNERTYTCLIFSMCVLAVHIYSKNHTVNNSERAVQAEKYIFYGLIVCAFLNLMYLVGTRFY